MAAESTWPEPEGEIVQQLTLTVTGMHCSSCGILIDDGLEDLPGVVQARTNVRKGVTRGDHDGKVSAAKVIKVVSGLGYRAQVIA